MARKIEINADGGGFTALTVSSSCTGVTTGSIEKYTSITTGNDWDTIVTGTSADADAARLTAATNTSSSSREGYGLITYTVNDNTCSNIIHLVQAGAAGCSCSDITSFPTTYGSDFTFVTFTQGATSMTITYTETCEMYIENGASDWLTVTKETSDLKFTVTGQTTDYRSGTVFIRPSSTGDVCKTIVVQQYPNETCACSDLTWRIYPYQPNFTTLYDLGIDECDGQFSISYYVKKKSDGSDVWRIAGGWEDQDIAHSVTCSPDDGEPNLTDEDKVYSVLIEADRACECGASDLEVTYIQPPCYTGCATAELEEEHQGQEPDEHWHTWVKLTNNVGDEYDGYARVKLRTYQNGTGWNDYESETTTTVHGGAGNQFDLGIFNGSYTGFYISEVLYACDSKGRKLEPC